MSLLEGPHPLVMRDGGASSSFAVKEAIELEAMWFRSLGCVLSKPVSRLRRCHLVMTDGV